jgi:hypothetical protein
MAVYYIDSYGGDTQLLVKGVAKVLSLAKDSRFRQAAVAAHTKNQISHSNIWEEAIGELATKNLAKGLIKIEGCTLYLLTERIDPSAFIQGPILAAAINTEFLNRVLKNRKATDVVFVPWLEEELEDFKRSNPDAISF